MTTIRTTRRFRAEAPPVAPPDRRRRRPAPARGRTSGTHQEMVAIALWNAEGGAQPR
jgi:hypothetical protein